MAIQARRGLETDFKPEKMLPGELAVTTDTRKIYATFAPGDCKRMATYEDMVDDIEEANEEIIRNMTTVVSEATTNAQNATAAAETATTNATAAAEAAEQAAQSVTATIATSTQAGAVKPTNDFLIGEAGALKLNTEFTVPEGLTNLVSGSDWNVILGQLAKMVGEYIDEKLNGYSTIGDVIAYSGSSPISMTGLKSAIDTLTSNLKKAESKLVKFTLSNLDALNTAVQGLIGVKKITAFMECSSKKMWCIGIWCVNSAKCICLSKINSTDVTITTTYGFELYYDANNYEIIKVKKDTSGTISFAYQAKIGFAGDTTNVNCALLIEY